ncbi:IPP transferase-domain-containing protein [Morchella snyderi]|nr:IPP transferase-domain-containing protein [Morchella snyderi]
MSSVADTRRPLITIIGATGTGKSNLAVDLALALNGEIINADAMQMYAGLPIITNKITLEEARGVPHHLLGVLDARDAWQVGRFVSEAGRIIAEIHSRNKVPILVGGTHYYIQSLLHPTTITPASASASTPTMPSASSAPAALPPLVSDPTTPTAALHAHLTTIDPTIASHWHPNDRRKILRSLTIYYTTGQRPSSLYAAQPTPHSPYRALLLWVHAATPALRARLDNRVDAMLCRGMGDEIEQMKALWDEAGDTVDATAGIWQSIGFKEFLPFMRRRAELGVERELKVLLETGMEGMKTATRQYAKSQVRWIQQKLIPALDGGDALFLLDSTSPEEFVATVCPTGVGIARAFLAGEELPNPRGLGALAEEVLGAERKGRGGWSESRECNVCETVCVGEEQWRVHVRSNRHKKAVGRQKRGSEVEAWKAWELERRRWKETGCVGEEPRRPGADVSGSESEDGSGEDEDVPIAAVVAAGSSN